VRRILKWSGVAGIAGLVVVAGLSFNAMPAGARASSPVSEYNGGRMPRHSEQYSQPRYGGRGWGRHASHRGNSYGNRDGRGQNHGWGNNGCGNSGNGQRNQGGSWNQGGNRNQGGNWNQGGRDQQGQGRRGAGGQQGGNRPWNQNGNGGGRDQGNSGS
jgi:hypothetical protein